MARQGPLNLPSPGERWFRRGYELARAGRYHEALEPLEQALAYTVDEPHPPFAHALRSYYGMSIALVRGEVLRGRKLCQEACFGDRTRADLFVNLARVYSHAGRKRLAVESLTTAVSISPMDRDAWTLMAELGYRRPPVVGFLPRAHPVNRVLGLVRHRILGAESPPL